MAQLDVFHAQPLSIHHIPSALSKINTIAFTLLLS
jgi:hypothetical protein